MNELDDQDIFAPGSKVPRCEIPGCDDLATVRLYGSGIYANGWMACASHGVEYERRGYGRTLEDFWEKYSAREARRAEERRRGYGDQLQIGRPR